MMRESGRKRLDTSWMGLSLSSPLVLASLTLLSNVSVASLVDYYAKAIDYGAGAIVLPSVNPCRADSASVNRVRNRALKIETGLDKDSYMGFAVQGPIYPNLPSPSFGSALVTALREKMGERVPIIGSVLNNAESDNVIKCCVQLCDSGLDGIELNLSCPNMDNDHLGKLDNTIGLVEDVKAALDIPLSAKLAPADYLPDFLTRLSEASDSVTLSNAYVGLVPPRVEGGGGSPFGLGNDWALSGVYGPFERPLAFKHLLEASMAIRPKCDIACVGGMVASEHVLQALMLGADIVQLSSAIAWNGLRAFRTFNDYLVNWVEENGYSGLDDIRSIFSNRIHRNVDCLTDVWQDVTYKVNDKICKKCSDCACAERLCVAFIKEEHKAAQINKDLCSGCGWCSQSCPYGAIEVAGSR